MHNTTSSRAIGSWIWLIIPLLAAALLIPALAVRAGPPPVPAMGITPTPTPSEGSPTPTPPGESPTATPPAKQILPVAPAITKRSDKDVLQPGEEATFTIEATNTGEQAAVGVIVTDEISEWLEILEVTTTQGTATVNGQTVTVNVGVIGPEFVVQIQIRTRLRKDTPVPIEIENVATLRSPNGGEWQSSPVLLRVLTLLPETGGHLAPWLLLVLVGLAGAGGGLWRQWTARRDGPEGRGDS
jgi:uncharacterized repeat protein (TIGR01451 family)